MKVKEAIKLFKYQQKANLKQRTIYSYNYLLKRFEIIFSCLFHFLKNHRGYFSGAIIFPPDGDMPICVFRFSDFVRKYLNIPLNFGGPTGQA